MEKESTLIGVGTEITELVSAQVTIDQLKEFDRLKDEILKVTSHEFKTPLVSIVGLSEVMYKKRQQLSQGFDNYIEVIHRESLRLNDLVQKMVEAARHEKNQVVVKKEAFDLVALLAGLPDSLQSLLQRNGSHLKFITAVPELGIVSDAGKIVQVINNLLDNAVKYGKAGQVILLRLSLAGRRAVKVEVIDQGPGIQEADKEKLFEKFYRIDSSLTRSQEGIGLGLYLCKQNIELLGGQIGVQNQAEGGANFYFILPLK
jgi:two-component system OmpR family sensor kinase